MSDAVLEVEGLVKRYGDLVAVDGLDFVVAPGEILGLLGPNGAGKTTTLRAVVGIIRPIAGRIRVAGHDLALDPIAAKRELAFVPDEPRLFDYLTVEEHVRFTARLYGVTAVEERAAPLYAELELGDRRESLPGELSRGMRQKVAVLCAFLREPKLLLFDEPLTGLDPLGIRRLKESIRRRAERGTAVVVSSHLLGLVAELCDRVLVMQRGRKLLHGSLAEIREALPGLASEASLEDVFLRATGADVT